ncbi:hypothetical protein QJS10_CPA16g00397 [Acorus calamus]|uniref:Uncharacterized protein n=1 Tax=Acorus calamus TaxID=4465 RepID=A0AAV9D1E3_ACOCL|nr:hypothetical protein QJS10_CPA16g00397 [Acorus calamus]
MVEKSKKKRDSEEGVFKMLKSTTKRPLSMVPNTLSFLFLLASLTSACEFPAIINFGIPTPTSEATPPPSARSHLLMGRLISARPSEGTPTDVSLSIS